MRTVLLFGLVALTLTWSAGCQRRVDAARRAGDPEANRNHKWKPSDGKLVTIVFTAKDKKAILDYLKDGKAILDYLKDGHVNGPDGLPPGLAKKDGLPSGLEMPLERNDQLPSGLEDRLEPFSHTLEEKLMRLPKGSRRVFLGNRALILSSTNFILDMFEI